jgi:hypothetical protein
MPGLFFSASPRTTNSSMKYAIAAVILLVVACALFLARGEIDRERIARRQQLHNSATRSTLARESIQELAKQYEECFPASASRAPKTLDADYCHEVELETDARPLEAVPLERKAH